MYWDKTGCFWRTPSCSTAWVGHLVILSPSSLNTNVSVSLKDRSLFSCNETQFLFPLIRVCQTKSSSDFTWRWHIWMWTSYRCWRVNVVMTVPYWVFLAVGKYFCFVKLEFCFEFCTIIFWILWSNLSCAIGSPKTQRPINLRFGMQTPVSLFFPDVSL